MRQRPELEENVMERYVRVIHRGAARFGRIVGVEIELLDVAPWLGGRPTADRIPLDYERLICPVQPSKIVCIGRNYRAHAAEMGGDAPPEPLLFLKPPSALLAPLGNVVLPRESTRVDYEAELGVVIGRRCRRVSAERSLDHVFGFTPVCDVTARDLQKRDGQWSRAKGFDTFCPVGPTVSTRGDGSDLRIQLFVGDDAKQDARTSAMIFGIPELIAHISAAMTLEPGDLIATGTPEGVGPLTAGDTVRVVIESLDELKFRVVSEPALAQ
jgi:2-keto-4-pentenoate hydratase/2-oxohepta-3-ene-1,7-dioic acid hydratase in catechol pathway